MNSFFIFVFMMDALEPFNKAEEQFDKGNYKNSIRLYSLAIELDPDNASYIAQRGVAFFHLGKIEEALYDLDQALKLEPENPFRYSSRAFILSNLNRIDEAINDYKQAIRLDPEDAIAYNNLGLLEEKKGYRKSAEENFKKADKLEGLRYSSSSKEKASGKEKALNYKELNYLQFFKRLFKDADLRADFYRFIRKGFK